MVSTIFDSRTPMMPLICTKRVIGTVAKSESFILSEEETFVGPPVVVPLPSTTFIAAAQTPASPKSHANTSPMVYLGKFATVVAPSEEAEHLISTCQQSALHRKAFSNRSSFRLDRSSRNHPVSQVQRPTNLSCHPPGEPMIMCSI